MTSAAKVYRLDVADWPEWNSSGEEQLDALLLSYSSVEIFVGGRFMGRVSPQIAPKKTEWRAGPRKHIEIIEE